MEFYHYQNYDFYIEQITINNKNFWRSTICHLYKDKLYKYTFTTFKTKKETLEKLRLRVDTSKNLEKTLIDNIKATINKNYIMNPKIRTLFTKIFGFDIRKCIDPMFFNYGLGFNVIKFDRLINTPNGISTIEYVTNKYGDVAIKLLHKLANGELENENFN